jgi:membrane-associated phospholipid phosphatase
MTKLVRTVAAVTAAVFILGGATAAAASNMTAHSRTGSTADGAAGTGAPVVQWNQELQAILKLPGAQPATVHPTRSYAILHAAIYDAVVSITHDDRPYLFEVTARRDARPDVAADQAAHDVLVNLYPGQQPALDAMLAGQLATVPLDFGTVDGKRVGHLTAELMLGIRADDGSAAAPPPFTPPPAVPGAYQLTPPNHPAPVFINWGSVAPFVLEHGDEFRPPPPPALSSATWAAAINEVESLGRDTSTTRTPDETNAAKFWAPPIWTTWNEVADGQATVRRMNLEQTAKTFATLNLTLADTTISLYDAKYHYLFWRPVTAIRSGTPGNPDVTADPNWNPLATTAADPSYPGAHSSLSAAAATVLSSLLGGHVDLTVTTDMPVGGARHFSSFQAAATEAGLSRIFAGQHTRIDHEAGVEIGTQVARTVLRGFGEPAR